MNNHYPFISALEIPVRWVDLDAYGHVNNAVYFNYTTEARIIFFGADFNESTIHFVVAETHCSYKKSFHYPSTVIVEQYLKELGHAYMVFHYAFYLAGDKIKQVHAEVTTKIVCFDPHKRHIVRIPDTIAAKLNR